MNLNEAFPNLEVHENHPLAPYTTLKIGGPADIFIHTKSSEEFRNVLRFIYDLRSTIYDLTILGNGSNVLISDSGIRGIVIKNDSNEIELLPENKIRVSSGTQLSHTINFCLDHNLLGLENFAYIPSTIGGAIVGNIHGLTHHFSDFIDSVEKYNDIIVSATLKLIPGDSSEAKKQVQETIQKKSLTQPMNSAGCVFKNPSPDNPAGLIIDQKLNLKGKQIGGAQISPLHANFIVNTGHATAKDYLALINLIQSQMQTKFGFQFELEIKLLGEF